MIVVHYAACSGYAYMMSQLEELQVQSVCRFVYDTSVVSVPLRLGRGWQADQRRGQDRTAELSAVGCIWIKE